MAIVRNSVSFMQFTNTSSTTYSIWGFRVRWMWKDFFFVIYLVVFCIWQFGACAVKNKQKGRPKRALWCAYLTIWASWTLWNHIVIQWFVAFWHKWFTYVEYFVTAFSSTHRWTIPSSFICFYPHFWLRSSLETSPSLLQAASTMWARSLWNLPVLHSVHSKYKHHSCPASQQDEEDWDKKVQVKALQLCVLHKPSNRVEGLNQYIINLG